MKNKVSFGLPKDARGPGKKSHQQLSPDICESSAILIYIRAIIVFYDQITHLGDAKDEKCDA